MNVFFGENYWGCRRGHTDKTPGTELRIEKEFIWGGRSWRIPAVYICREGIVMDFCVRIPAKEIEAFFRKWKPGTEEADLSEEEQERLERENPLSEDVFVEQLWMDGERADGWSGCGTSFVPPELLGDGEARAGDDMEAKMLEGYGCDCTDGWIFKRVSFAFPQGVQLPLCTLRLILKKASVYEPGPRFHTSVTSGEGGIEFFHPVTKKRHTLTIQKLEQSMIPESELSGNPFETIKLLKVPRHFLSMFYTVEPKLEPCGLQIYDCAQSDSPVLAEKNGTSSVQVIGGADGPSSAFLAFKPRDSRGDWNSVYSSVHYKPVEDVEWGMRFRIKNEEKKSLKLCCSREALQTP